jgi:hypothetical protein
MLGNLGDAVLDDERVNTIKLKEITIKVATLKILGRSAHGGIISDACDDLRPQRTILVWTCIHESSEGIGG